jgi:hypothetical protein
MALADAFVLGAGSLLLEDGSGERQDAHVSWSLHDIRWCPYALVSALACCVARLQRLPACAGTESSARVRLRDWR